MSIKSIIVIVASLLLSTLGYSQTVTYVLTDSISEGHLKTQMESNISRLLTAINDAYSRGSSKIDYTGIDISDSASYYIGSLWTQFRFHTEKDRYAGFCLKLSGKEIIYRQGNIGVVVNPVNGNMYSGTQRREVSIYIDRNGKIVDFAFTKEKFEYEQVFKEGESLKDLDKREQIVKWCQYLQQAYCDKDINFIDDVFSDDALILVGKITMIRVRENDHVVIKEKSSYKEYSKKEYIERLKTTFDRNGYVNVKFDDFQVQRHGINKNFYGVTLKQIWRSTTYSDTGILFLVWDFTDENNPMIHVRVWQHPKQDRFDIGDFEIPKPN